jgi:hypothetical protein
MPRRGVDLTEDQWRIVKAHAARRGQTISQFFADAVAAILSDGTVLPPTIVDPVSSHDFGGPRPAPKPTARKK